MRLLIQHRSHYGYPRPAALGPHLVRLRPANHTKARIEAYSLTCEQPCELRWQQDPYSNHVARVSFRKGVEVESFDLLVELAVDIKPVNPFDFFLDDRCQHFPWEYPRELQTDLKPFFDLQHSSYDEGPLFHEFLHSLPEEGHTSSLIVELNRRVCERVRYVIREELGVWTPEETLRNGMGSCRDSATLLVAVLRSRGFAARFVSGYLVQLTDEGMIPGEPKGVGRDVVDLHAWAEVYLPGAGWIGLDATSGLLCGEGHIPLAATAVPQLAAPIEGTSSVAAAEVSFQMTVGRLGHEPRPTTPYTEEAYAALREAGRRADERLELAGVRMTMGGEPTFNSREYPEAPEWNGDALGPTKWNQGLRLARELRKRLAPGGVLMLRQGKWYPGESLPRWALDLYARKDGLPIWHDEPALQDVNLGLRECRYFAKALARRLKQEDNLILAYEDPWRFLQDEARLPADADPLKADLNDPEERRRLARVLERGLANEAGYVLPLSGFHGQWTSQKWTFRRGNLFLIQGDSPLGLRLPLNSIDGPPPPPLPAFEEEPYEPPDPRQSAEEQAMQRRFQQPGGFPPPGGVRTALCVEERGGQVYVFLPPLWTTEDFFLLVQEIDEVRHETGLDVLIEGYAPPPGPNLFRLSVTPDPGVLEVNIPPVDTMEAHAALMEPVFDAALHAGLHAEKYLLDGRMAGSGGGHHITLGGESPLRSPFLQRPDLLASLVTFVQHHPSLSYMFTGLFVGPTSQAPRPDEARHDQLYELEIALRRAFQSRNQPAPPPWFTDLLFRNLLTDMTGNTHRAEISLDKLFDPHSAHGRQGLIELRAFEMPPHVRMIHAQVLLVRSLIAAFAEKPYQGRLVRWGQMLHDRFLLPHWLWRDFEDVLEFLADRGLPLPPEGYRPFLDLRCPVIGQLNAGDVILEIRNAIEPWHVLGEESTASGVSRYVDSSMERVEVRADGLLPERHRVLVNGHELPMRPAGKSGEAVGGVRFRAWAPPHSLHPHIGIHHPLRFDVLDTWSKRSLGGCAYHVWHPEGRAFNASPLTRFEAEARRLQRFTIEGPSPWPVRAVATAPHPDQPWTFDLRRFDIDRPMPEPEEEE
ncbi:MAG: hypothetical protein GMKNLPBB_02645 [Myxococcota bacterium]|nr:hypothetical protein [Myxococcota bacterium]